MSDPCECFFNHEAAMSRLLSLLQSGQEHCTDSGCLTDGLPATANSGLVLWSLLWTILAMGLYLMRPNSMRSGNQNRQNEAVLEKPGPSSRDNDNHQPPPPPAL